MGFIMFGRKKKTNNKDDLIQALMERDKEYKEQLTKLKETQKSCDNMIKELREQLLIFRELKEKMK